MSKFPRDIQVTLCCKSLLPVDEPAMVGIQDRDRCVQEGLRGRNGALEFQCVIQVRNKGADDIDFFGPFVHGTSGARFIYLSWKRISESPTPWVQRVKIPLALRTTDLETATEIRTDITGRRPHATEPIVWTIANQS